MNDLKFACRQLLKNPGLSQWVVISEQWLEIAAHMKLFLSLNASTRPSSRPHYPLDTNHYPLLKCTT